MEQYCIVCTSYSLSTALRYMRMKYDKHVLCRNVQDEFHNVIMEVERRRSL